LIDARLVVGVLSTPESAMPADRSSTSTHQEAYAARRTDTRTRRDDNGRPCEAAAAGQMERSDQRTENKFTRVDGWSPRRRRGSLVARTAGDRHDRYLARRPELTCPSIGVP
jgi:hypothetical protein